jgi:uncharacterized protein YndB with AHSA1/START domain
VTDKPPPGPDSVRLERTIAAPRETVFDAWLTADVLKRWWPAGSDWETPIAEIDARVGGRLRLVMRSPDHEEFGGTGEFIEIERPERLVYSWTWDGHGAHEGTNLVEVEFRDVEHGTTLVVLTNRGLPHEEARRAHREGWETSLDNLERVLQE